MAGGLNTYSYVTNNPLKYIDPEGLSGATGTWDPDPVSWGDLVKAGRACAAMSGTVLAILASGTISGSVPVCGGDGGVNPPGCRSGDNDPCKGLRDQVKAHEKKLQDYTADPAGHDNLGFLGQGNDAQVIAGRIRSLQNQIANFKKQLAECERLHGK